MLCSHQCSNKIMRLVIAVSLIHVFLFFSILIANKLHTMTVSKSQFRKKNTPLTLELSGSQINLSPRPVPVTHVVWAPPNCRNYPIRRSASAFGFQQTEEEVYSKHTRPLSADSIRYINRKSSMNDFQKEISISLSSSQDHNEMSALSDNVFENILNGYSESKRRSSSITSEYQNIENNLKPGLSSKPPLPPAELKSIRLEYDEENLLDKAENTKTAAEKEAFDEIIALKFQKWFPNNTFNPVEGSSSDDEVNDVELLSYKQRNYQTYEYKYEILRKNDKKANEKKINRNSNKSKKNKKLSSKRTTTIISDTKIPSNNYRREITTTLANTNTNTNTHTLEGGDNNIENKIQYDNAELNDNKSITSVMLEQQDHEKIHVVEKKDEKYKRSSASNSNVDTKSKLKASFSKKSNFHSSPNDATSKKYKKITFSLDKQNDMIVVNQNPNFVEPCFASKISNSENNIHENNNGKVVSVNANVSLNANTNDGEDIENTRKTETDKTQIRDTSVSPQQPAGSQIEDVQSWMGTHRSVGTNKTDIAETGIHTRSMYEEMIDILKDIEQEDIQDSPKFDDENETSSKNKPTNSSSPLPSPADALWSLIEAAEKNDDLHNESNGSPDTNSICTQDAYISRLSPTNQEEKNWSCLSDLLRLSSTELAQKVMALQLSLHEKDTLTQNLKTRLKTTEQLHQQQKQDLEFSLHKHQKLIEQLKMEKKSSHEKLQNVVNELEKKHAAALVVLDEKYKIDLKKILEKQVAADKMEREKWLEMKTQKIKELAIKGLEPELNRMAAAHQEEIAEMRRFHKRQIEEIEDALNRRMTIQKEKMEAEKEKALAIEREISRQKLEDEIGELEKRYQDQRKRLLAEVHVERESMERENEAALAIKEKENERKWEKKSIDMHKKIQALQNQHQEEIKVIQQKFETEKQTWMKNQMVELSEKEHKIKEQYKKERDKQIEFIIQKLESENTEREKNSEQKIKRLKEQYEAEFRDMETANENFRRKLNESRNEIQKSEDIVSQLRAQLNLSQTEYVILKEKHDRLLTEQGEMQNAAKSELTTRIHILQSELHQTQLIFESQLKALKSEHERELSQLHSRVREMVQKKDDLINTLKKQKDAALQQCNQFEKILQLKRKDNLL